MKLWTFEVKIESQWVSDPVLGVSSGSTTNGRMRHTAVVSLAGVELHRKDVSAIVNSGAPGRENDAADEVMTEFAEMLRDRLIHPMMLVTPQQQ